MVFILDNGHGKSTAGKRSPIWHDGSQLFEYEFNRNIVLRLTKKLASLNIDFYVLVGDDNDVSLQERCRRANEITKLYNGNALLISIHGNAGGGTGWECYTTPGQTKSDIFADMLCKAAKKEFPDKKMRFDLVDGDYDKEEPFYILKNTICPAVLSENFFMDTESDCRLMMSDRGREKIANLHLEAIKQYIK